MIAKLTLISTKDDKHPMAEVAERVGYIRDLPDIGHPMILWSHVGEGSRFLRTTAVKGILKSSIGREYQIVETQNSSYRLDILPVQFEQESLAFSAAVNGRVKEI